MQYLKSGFSPLEPDACDRLERYAYFWNIRGSQWLKPWTRHPEGFGQTFDEETDRQLLTLNVWREGAMEPLQTLHEVWLSGRTDIRAAACAARVSGADALSRDRLRADK